MRRKFIINLALLLFLNLLIKPFWIFGIDMTVQNLVGAEQYGFYFPLFNFSVILNILLDLGINNFNNRNIAQNNQLLSKHLSNIMVLKLTLGVVYFFVASVVAVIIGWGWKEFQLLLFLLFNQLLASFTLYFRSNLSALHLFKIDSLISVFDRVLAIIICGTILLIHYKENTFRIEWFVYAQTAAYALTALTAFFFLLSKTDYMRMKFDSRFSLAILKQSYPYALLMLLMIFYIRVDAIMIERLLPDGKEQAGIYAHSFRILDAASMFAYLFAALLLPIFAKMIKNKEPIDKLVRLSFLLLFVPTFIVSATCYVYSHEIIGLLYREHIVVSGNIFAVLILSFIPISSSYIFGTLLTANGNLKQMNLMAAGGMVLNVVLNLILIPKMYAYGAAVASLITQLATAAAQVFIARHIFHLRLNIKTLLHLILFAGGVCALSFFGHQLPVKWFFSFGMIVICSVLLAFATKIFKIKSLLRILKDEK